MKDIISMNDFTKDEIIAVLDCAKEVKEAIHDENLAKRFEEKYSKSVKDLLKGEKVATLFLENSTRTNFSTRAAAGEAGAFVDGFATMEHTSLKKGETWEQTICMFAGYGYSSIVMRSTWEGLSRWSVEALEKNQKHINEISNNLKTIYSYKRPFIINAGDGRNQHPTQCFLDLFTIREVANSHGKGLDNLDISFLNDLKYGRTNASLMSVAPLFNFRLHLAHPPRFGPDKNKIGFLKSKGVMVIDYKENFLEALRNSFVAYHSRPQKERVAKGEDLFTIKKMGQINKKMFDELESSAPYLMHPLPVDSKTFEEISFDMRYHPKNITTLQSSNGLYVRIALLAFGLKKIDFPIGSKIIINNNVSLIELETNGKERELTNPRSGYIDGDGIVIDHIPLGKARRLAGIIGLENREVPKVISDYMPSKKGDVPKKDMIKIHLKYELDRKQLQAIAMIAPLATISIIDDSRVVRKFRAKLGNFVEGRIVCGNQNCITNVVFEPVENKHKYLGNNFFQCHYCEKMDTLDLIYNEKRFIYVE